MTEREELKRGYLDNPSTLLNKSPFRRGIKNVFNKREGYSRYNEKSMVQLPNLIYKTVGQDTFLRELDPLSHDVLYDNSIPAICRKLSDDRYEEIKYDKMACSIQKNIVEKVTLHLCANLMQFTLLDTNPTDKQKEDFITIKKYWKMRNQDGMKSKMVYAQKSLGDAGLLYYFDYQGRIKSRLLCYPDYIILPLNDNNGDRLLDSVYYQDGDYQRIDSYDDKYLYRFINDGSSENGWFLEDMVLHGFEESPLITHRGEVAWNNVQSEINHYEIIFNIYNVIQKRQGWGLLFIKGNPKWGNTFNGSFVLTANGMNGNEASAEYKTPPTGEGMKDALNLLMEQIQKGAGFTQLLPKDITSMGDISGVAIQFSMSLDNQTALTGCIEYKNVADKMMRLFKYGLAKELNDIVVPNAITRFADVNISADFTVWMPKSDVEFSQRLVTLKQSGIISAKTATEICDLSKSDEENRLKDEEELKIQREKEANAQVVDINKQVETTTNVEEE